MFFISDGGSRAPSNQLQIKSQAKNTTISSAQSFNRTKHVSIILHQARETFPKAWIFAK